MSFLLACAAVALGTGWAVSLVTAGLLPLFRRLAPARRADLAFVAGVLPALAAVSVVAPSLSGLLEDHCETHLHHLHLCAEHFGELPPALALLGAFSLALWLFRTAAILAGELQAARALRRLMRIARTQSAERELLVAPGEARLCHAAGIFRPRILVSESVLTALSETEAEAALAHEAAHVRRRDPLALFLLRLTGVFALTGTSFAKEYREAAELACDREAARAVGNPVELASALVRVARLNLSAPKASALAFHAPPLEQGFRALLQGDVAAIPGRHFVVAGAAALVCALSAVFAASAIHHAVESALHHLF